MSKSSNNSTITDSEYYTIKQVAEILEVTSQTVSNYLRNGGLSGQKRGPKKKWHISGTEIKRKLREWNQIS